MHRPGCGDGDPRPADQSRLTLRMASLSDLSVRFAASVWTTSLFLGNDTCAGYSLLMRLIKTRPHRSLQKDAPMRRTVQRIGDIVAIPILGGLHHQYVRI